MAPRSRRPVTRAINNQFDCNGLPNATKKVPSARQLVRQDGGVTAPRAGRDRPGWPMAAHQLASAYKKLVDQDFLFDPCSADVPMSQLLHEINKLGHAIAFEISGPRWPLYIRRPHQFVTGLCHRYLPCRLSSPLDSRNEFLFFAR